MSQALWCRCSCCHFIRSEPQRSRRKRHKWHDGIPTWQPPSWSHKHSSVGVDTDNTVILLGVQLAASAFFICTCFWCFASPLSSRLGPDTAKETKPHSRGLTWCLAYVFVDKNEVLWGSLWLDPSRLVGAMEPTPVWSWRATNSEEIAIILA